MMMSLQDDIALLMVVYKQLLDFSWETSGGGAARERQPWETAWRIDLEEEFGLTHLRKGF